MVESLVMIKFLVQVKQECEGVQVYDIALNLNVKRR